MALHFNINFKLDIAKLFQLFIVNNLFSPKKTKILIKKHMNEKENKPYSLSNKQSHQNL